MGSGSDGDLLSRSRLITASKYGSVRTSNLRCGGCSPDLNGGSANKSVTGARASGARRSVASIFVATCSNLRSSCGDSDSGAAVVWGGVGGGDGISGGVILTARSGVVAFIAGRGRISASLDRQSSLWRRREMGAARAVHYCREALRAGPGRRAAAAFVMAAGAPPREAVCALAPWSFRARAPRGYSTQSRRQSAHRSSKDARYCPVGSGAGGGCHQYPYSR